MIGHCTDLLDVQVIAHFLQDVVAKFLPLVRHQAPWEPIVSEVVVLQALGDGHCSLVIDFVGLHVAWEMVGYDKDFRHCGAYLGVHHSLQPQQIDMHQVHWLRCCNVAEWWFRVFPFEHLALAAIQYVVHHLRPHLLPPKPFLQQGVGPITPLVPRIMVTQIEHHLALVHRYNEEQYALHTVLRHVFNEQ